MSDNVTGFLNLRNARTPEQQELMERIAVDGVCPFCVEHFKKYHPRPVLKETDYWFFTENISPYIGTRHHFLFVYKPRHITTPDELEPEALVDLFAVLDWARNEFGINGGTFAMRFGTAKKYANSVMHLHAHLIEPDVDDPTHTGVKFPVSKPSNPQK